MRRLTLIEANNQLADWENHGMRTEVGEYVDESGVFEFSPDCCCGTFTDKNEVNLETGLCNQCQNELNEAKQECKDNGEIFLTAYYYHQAGWEKS